LEYALFGSEGGHTKLTLGWSSTDHLNGRDPARGGTLTLNDTDRVGTIIHEVGHMLGLCHEQDRKDDKSAEIVRDNYKSSHEVAQRSWKDCKNYGGFNSNSIMLYRSGYQEKFAPDAGDVIKVFKVNQIPHATNGIEIRSNEQE